MAHAGKPASASPAEKRNPSGTTLGGFSFLRTKENTQRRQGCASGTSEYGPTARAFRCGTRLAASCHPPKGGPEGSGEEFFFAMIGKRRGRKPPARIQTTRKNIARLVHFCGPGRTMDNKFAQKIDPRKQRRDGAGSTARSDTIDTIQREVWRPGLPWFPGRDRAA